MEPALRAWATARREQAGGPFVLHPADRARLQEDVARTLGPDARPAPVAVFNWSRFLPRLALGLGTAVVLLLAVRQLAPPRGEGMMDLAQREVPEGPASKALPAASSSEADPAAGRDSGFVRLEPARAPASEVQPPAQPAPEPVPEGRLMMQRYGLAPGAPRAQPQVGAASSEVSRMSRGTGAPLVPDDASATGTGPASAPAYPAGVPLDTTATPPTSPVPTAGQAQAKGPGVEAAAPAEEAESRPGEVVSMVAAPAVAQPAGEARARSSGATREARPDWAGAFTRTTVSRRNFNAPPDYALRSFRVEQRGAELRLLDEDGSVYRGVVLAAQPTAPGDSRITTFAGGTLPAGALAFRVYGTNQSAGRDLLFQGVLVTGATVRVQGQAILGGRDRIVVDAPGRAE